MLKILLLLVTFCFSSPLLAQKESAIQLNITNEKQAPLSHATVELLRSKDTTLVKIQMTDTLGAVHFNALTPGDYRLRISLVDHDIFTTPSYTLAPGTVLQLPPVVLQASSQTMQNVTVAARKPFIEIRPDKTIINLEASISNTGTTALEALEKLPGITVDKDGNISLNGKKGVLVLIDGKQTYLEAAHLSTLLSGMSAAQLSQVELMDQPSARYDAAGNAGIINIKTKKTKQKGFNGIITTAYSQGFYPKSNNSLQLNYRSGKANYFLSYSLNVNQSFTRIYALRRYLQQNEETVASLLEQPTYIRGKGHTDNLRLGMDYFINPKTSMGVVLNGLMLSRNSQGNNTALWMDAGHKTDSVIQTQSRNLTSFKNGGANLNLQHQFNATQTLTADIDILGYQIKGAQAFDNNAVFPRFYTEALRAFIPSTINIISAKADYSQQLQNTKVEGGWKTSYITTDNLADYEYLEGSTWKPDLGKTNHFLYRENIHAVYATAQSNLDKWTVQGGLRYELTHYDAKQLGNALRKDSAFSRTYNSLFPSFFASYAADSSHTWSFTAGRRIDRPAFQDLNPFLFIINKYTYQQGNPFFRPQYTWNLELNHQYKEVLTTGISYSNTKDYFSQIFPIDSTGIVIYTEGNLDNMQNWGLSVGVQVAPSPWWSFTAQAIGNHKKLRGLLWKDYRASITQFTINMNHQLRFQKGWGGEVSGFYTSRSQQDLQEIVDPAGQLSLGISKNIWQNKATLKLAVRDLFYTQWMKGLTYFNGADEYFKLTRDTRIATFSFTWRFGKAAKTNRRSAGAAGDEIERVGTGS